MASGIRAILARIFLSTLLGGSAWAQSEVGLTGINSTVTDPSGAAVCGAAVSVHSNETGLQRETKTTDAGFYTVPGLRPGTYEITVQQQGFATAVRSGVHLTVGSAATWNIALALGQTAQVTDVSAEAAVV
ncbi:MAG: TonB-dependent receptor domain protein, partial [Bryobacterales bacterium]|nr:TonB-dependent receptor domain protein [Bryobacterales bacterium]